MRMLPRSTACVVGVGPLIDDTDFKTAETGMAGTMAVTLIFSDATSAARHSTGTILHRAAGHYAVPLDGSDTAIMGNLRVVITNAGALQAWGDFFVAYEDVYEAFRGNKVFATDPDNSTMAAQIGTMYTGYDATNNLFKSDLKRADGDAAAITNLTAAFNGTGYAFPNSNMPVNLVSLAGSTSDAAKLAAMARATIEGTVVAGTLTSTVLTSNVNYISINRLNGRWLFFLTGSNRGVAAQIAGFAQTNGTFTLATALPIAPSAGDTFAII